jgi:cytochrome P450
MKSSVDWHCQDEELNPFVRSNPMRPLIEWYNGRTMNRYINAELDKCYEEWRHNSKPTTQAKSVMDIAIAAYMSDRQAVEKLDPQFKSWATAQIRLFLFAGHDSTAATIVYSLYLLSKDPAALTKIRAEHDEVFGRDVSSAAQMLKERPQLINQLTYTTAVIRETLRLLAPASGMRGGLPHVYLCDKNGNKFPTEGLNI